jgi:hypothetical protein
MLSMLSRRVLSSAIIWTSSALTLILICFYLLKSALPTSFLKHPSVSVIDHGRFNSTLGVSSVLSFFLLVILRARG